MPSCSALGCTVRSTKGQLLTLKIFPRKDKNRRKIWIERVKRPGWTPSRYSVLCELHFDSDQWEGGKEDRKRRLKKTAVPTVFHVAPQSDHLVVSIDHPYCQTGLRQIYTHTDEAKSFESKNLVKAPRKWKNSKSKKNGNDRLPEFEHVDVNVDEHSIFTPELANVEEEEEDEASNCGVKVKDEPEDIQCTPDICMWQSDEPDPIEMVNCCDGETTNLIESEPCNDPLAISADDMVHMKGDLPNFAHTKKYLFVPKVTKPLPASVSRTATGEPRPAVSAEEPRIKVLSPARLLLPKPPTDQPHLGFKAQKMCVVSTQRKVNVVLPYAVKTSNTNNEFCAASSPPKIQVMPKSLWNEDLEITTIATYLRKTPPSPPKLTPAPLFGEQFKLNVVGRPQENVVRDQSFDLLSSSNATSNATVLPLPKLQEAPTFYNVSGAGEPSSDATTVTRIPLTGSSLSVAESQLSSAAPDVISLTGKKGVMNFQANNLRLSELSKHLGNKKIVLIKKKKLARPIIVRKKNVGISDHMKRMAFLRSMENFAQLENICLEHEYASDLSWKPVSLKGFKLKADSIHNYCGTKLYPLTRSENGSKDITSAKRISEELFRPSLALPVIKSSSLLVVNPFDKKKAFISLNKINNNTNTEPPPLIKIKKENKFTELPSQVNQNTIPPLNASHLKLYKCDMCKFSFLTPASLQIHSDSHDNMSTKLEGKEDSSDTDTASTVTADEPEDESKRGGQLANAETKEFPPADRMGSGRPVPCCSDESGSSSAAVGIPDVEIFKELKLSLEKTSLRFKGFKGFENSDLPILQSRCSKKEKLPCSLKESGNNNSQESSEVRYSLRHRNTPLSPKPGTIKKRRSKRSSVKKMYAQHDKTDNVLKGDSSLKQNSIILKPKLRKKEKSVEPGSVPVVANCSVKLDRIIIAKMRKEKDKSLKTRSANKSKNQADSNLSKNKKLKTDNSSSVNTKCPTCGMGVKKSGLNRHMMQHISVDINMYTCTICSKKFSKSYRLRKHITSDHKMKTTAKDFKCPKRYCGRSFESKRMLHKHTLISHKK